MRYFLLTISCLIFIASKSKAQGIEVNSASNLFSDKSIKGFVVCLELDVKTVERSWTRFLKSIGKFENSEKASMQGLNLMLSNVSNDAIDFFSKLTVSPRCVQIFMGALRAGSNIELAENQNENVKKMVYDFAIEQYRQDFISQISEAERVVNLAVKAHDKRGNEGANIKSRIVRNKKGRIKIFQELEENANQLKKLKADSIQNISEQETALEEISKVRKIAEDKKQKLSQLK